MAPTSEQHAEKLQAIAARPLSSPLAAISIISRRLPTLATTSTFTTSPNSSAPPTLQISSIPSTPPPPDYSADWLVSVHDEVFDQVDASLDKFHGSGDGGR